MLEQRQDILTLVNEACANGARQSKACELLGISPRTLQRWLHHGDQEDKRLTPSREPANKLSEVERQRMLKVASETDYADLPASKIVPKLADQGIYIASESSFYRVLKSHNQLKHRHASKPAQHHRPASLCAEGPNQVYTWDITYLPTQVKGLFLYLYLVMDIFSRKIVGWQVYEEEASALAADLMKDICLREGVERGQVILHSDNGSPMKGATLLTTLQQLGIMPSFSRPGVSNDNPYSESLFRTLKYRPEYPGQAFDGMQAARQWVAGFVQWYNHEHLHSSIKFVTPQQRHTGADKLILENRHQVYQKAKAKHPSRWSGDTRNWKREGAIYLNPNKAKLSDKMNKAA